MLPQGKLQLITTLERSDGTCASSRSNVSNGVEDNSSSHSRAEGSEGKSCLGLASLDTLSRHPGQDALAALDAHLQKALGAIPQRAQPGHYTLFIVPSTWPAAAATASEAGHSIVVGQHRHAWLVHDPSQLSGSALDDAAASAATLLLKRCFGLRSSAESISAAEGLPFSAAAHAVLSFTLLNADPTDGVVGWGDFGRFEQQYLRPVVDALGSVAHLTVDSQVRFCCRDC